MLYITFPQYLSYFQILFQRVHKLIKISIFNKIHLYYSLLSHMSTVLCKN